MPDTMVPDFKTRLLSEKSVLAMLVLLYVVASLWFVLTERKLEFNQNMYEAVVLRVCTGDFQELDPRQEATPELAVFHAKLEDFLQRKSAEISCADLPKNASFVKWPQHKFSWSETFARAYFYLSTLVAFLWSVFGIKWAVVKIAYVMLLGVSFGSAYYLFRQVMSHWSAGALTVLFHASENFVSLFHRLKDFSKLPFIFIVLGCSAALLVRQNAFRRALALAAVAGCASGIGFGFRTDLIAVVPLFLLAIFLAPPSSRSWHKPALAFVFLGGFSALGSPAFPSWMDNASNKHHVLILGQMEMFNEKLDISPAPYGLGHYYHDAYTCLLINAEMRASGYNTQGKCTDNMYAQAGERLFNKYFSLTFGDQILHSINAYLKVLTRAFGHGAKNTSPDGLFSALITLSGCFLLSLRSWRLGLFTFFSLIYLGGITALQFSMRHSLHLDIFFWLALGILAESASRTCLQEEKVKHVRQALDQRAAVIAIVMAASFFLMWTGLFTARVYQETAMNDMNKRFAAMPLRDASYVFSAAGSENEKVTIQLEHPKTGFTATYLALSFNPTLCGKNLLHLDVHYMGKHGFSERQILSSRKNKPFVYYIPVFFKGAEVVFNGLSVPVAEKPCLESIRLSDDLSLPGIPLRFVMTKDGGPGYFRTSALFSDRLPEFYIDTAPLRSQ